MDWTTEQLKAINTRDTSMIVSASAGSGKTAVLVNRLFEILSDTEHKIKADNIIVVTFTNDAAAELKQRLTKSFSEKLDFLSQTNQQQTELYHWLLKQRSLLGNAKISTIHAFCFDLIRENAEECKVSAQFKIAEQEDVYRKKALQNILEKFSRERKKDADLLFSYLCKKDDRELEQIILSIDNDLNSMTFPDKWLEQAKKICEEKNNILLDSILASFYQDAEYAIALANNQKIEKIALHAVELVSPTPENSSEQYPYAYALAQDIEKMQFILQKIKNSSIAELAKFKVADIKFITLPSSKSSSKKTFVNDAELQEVFKQIRDVYKTIYTDSFKSKILNLKYYLSDQEKQNKIIPLLLELTKNYREELFEEKKRQNVLCFSDAEYLALKLLTSEQETGKKSALAKTLSEQYALIMIDEYQDSNSRQDYIFKLLAHNSQNSENQELNYGDNIFLVGDVKQSIYGFRKAKPENFRHAISKKEMQLIRLNKNFRSSPGVIDFINALFISIMTDHCGEVNYLQNEQLNFGAKIYENLDKNFQKAQILFPQDKIPETGKIKKEFTLQAECIADKIADMIAQKIPVMTSDGLRPCEYKDFCILMRTKTNQSVLAESFKKRNIPFMCQNTNGFLSLPEIRLIWNLLKIADNPMTDIAMTSVLLSPLYCFTTDELAILKLLANDKKRLYLQIRFLAESEQNLSPEYINLAKKCNLFLEQLEKIRIFADRLPLEICIQEIYDMTDLISLQSLYENTEQRRENLEIFAQQAQSYREHADLTAQSCLSGWLRYLEHIEESEEKDKFAPKTAFHTYANYVTIKTIHGAKGLEYPFIFVANLERNFNQNNSKKQKLVLTNENGLLGLNMFDRKNCFKIKTVAFSYLDNLRKQKEKHEEMRLFYVALTRAKQQLFLVMDNSCVGYKNSSLLKHCPEIVPILAKEASNMQEWILQFLSSTGEYEYLQQAINGISNSSNLIDYNIWNPDKNQNYENKKNLTITALPDKNIILQVEKQLAYKYNSLQTILPAKYSVTELSHEKTEIHIHEPKFLSEDSDGNIKKLKGNARGTAVHKIMQFINFSQAEKNLQQELDQMQQAGLLTPIETKALEFKKLKAFFDSDLYKRVANSDNIQKEKQVFVKISELNLPETSELAKNYANTDGIIIGTLDLLFHEPDGWIIVDYKTNKSLEESELLKIYSKQLGLYQKAIELILGEPVKQAYIYYFTKNSTIEVDLKNINY